MKYIKMVLFFPKWMLLKLLQFYRLGISPLLGPRCRFYPTCSNYATEALQTHSLLKALCKIAWRILRCAPWNKGGYDPVIKNKPLKEDTYV